MAVAIFLLLGVLYDCSHDCCRGREVWDVFGSVLLFGCSVAWLFPSCCAFSVLFPCSAARVRASRRASYVEESGLGLEECDRGFDDVAPGCGNVEGVALIAEGTLRFAQQFPFTVHCSLLFDSLVQAVMCSYIWLVLHFCSNS